ncbi:DUF2071 domain-containing protein [Streptomyces sp. NBC_00365]|uniref:DUF2071 domain-containing protein n=1 Tax=Streptomyces sp. NBC_00365 TaxID=2975726 RepID=UPI002257BF96|nr:DUF2071 domain-containing protein [Streptomyces sp. NBC_00365]MCX5094008.1 DUF2071 domain-containing protein [Streptomyces sp. NBC_00365]
MRLPALRVGWLRQTFVHWPFRPEAVQALVLETLVVDEYDGAAWVGLTPFVMADMRLPGVPAAVPGLPSFAETNLRTYVRGRDNGRDGLWFLSIEVACPLMVAARAVGAPYNPGTLRVSANGDTVTYAGSRWTGGASYLLVVRPGGLIEPTERDVWLTSRWRAYTRRMGLLWQTPVEHEPWHLAGLRRRGAGGDADHRGGAPSPARRTRRALLGRDQECTAGGLPALRPKAGLS